MKGPYSSCLSPYLPSSLLMKELVNTLNSLEPLAKSFSYVPSSSMPHWIDLLYLSMHSHEAPTSSLNPKMLAYTMSFSEIWMMKIYCRSLPVNYLKLLNVAILLLAWWVTFTYIYIYMFSTFFVGLVSLALNLVISFVDCLCHFES